MEQLAQQGGELAANQRNLWLLDTNKVAQAQGDIHGHADPSPGTWSDGVPNQASTTQLELALDWQTGALHAADVGRVSHADLLTTHHLFRAITEVMNGKRRLLQLSSHLEPSAYLALQATVRQTPRTSETIRLRSLHTFQPTAGAIEACATIEQGRRYRAMAGRLQLRRIGWVCMKLAIL